MLQNFFISLCIFCGFQSVVAFNIDPVSWRNFPDPYKNQNNAFGYKMIQQQSSLIVSDPLIQTKDQRGQIYECPLGSTACRQLDIKVPLEAVNMSLGLSMIQDPYSSKLAICGPTIPKKCESITTYNGMCFVYRNSMAIENNEQSIPRSLRDCPGQIDIAFLLDGSGSVGEYDFRKMKTFVATMIKRFTGRDARFAIAQYGRECEIHYNFNQLNTKQDIMWEYKVSSIDYIQGGYTNTANAIKTVVIKIFGEARQSAKKILVVITDGQSNDRNQLSNAAEEASRKNIISMAIGVGRAFSQYETQKELNTIATDPDSDHVFRVTDFNALNSILQKLEDNIIAIEGTQTSGDSTRMEFAQDGFSIAFTSYGNVLVSAPGAFQWKGGYQEYFSRNSFQAGGEHDSYLGYSMAVAKVSQINYAILGAPRYQHQGQVVVYALNTQWTFTLDSPKPQIGSYFGAELCVVDLNADKDADLLLVSAPTYTEGDREGKVFVYKSHRNGFTYLNTELVGMAGQRGRFGSSVSSPTDLNGDRFNDVVIGAPLEDDGQGSIYIFNGKDGGIVPTYSQRIGGSSVQSGLRLFGISLSQSSLDQSQDNLADIAVGSMGTVLLLRSRPIMRLETMVTYNPSKISTSETDCTKPRKNTLKVCFTMSGYNHNIQDLSANIKYAVKLDSKHLKYRASFSTKNRILDNETLKLQAGEEGCREHDFFIEGCPEDALNPMSNQLSFTFEGLPSRRIQGLKPILLPEIKNTTDHNLDFEINCGQDNICVDDLKMDFNFTGSTNIEVGIMQEINVTVFVENRGENSYNTYLILKYPIGLSYRKITTKQGRVECSSHDGEQGGNMGQTTCSISKPIFKANAEAVFEITYSISKESKFGQNVNFTAEVKSGNGKHSENSILSQEKTIGVKYAIYIALIRHENSTIHINFTAGKRDLNRPIKQILKVDNELRETNFTVSITVPMKLGDLAIWTNSDFQISGCKRIQEQQPVTNKLEIKEVIKKHRVLNCSVAVCAVFTCDVNLMRNEWILYNISGNVSSGWIEQTDLKAAVIELVSTASLVYDKSKYVFFSTDSRHSTPTVKIITQVEVYEEVDLTKEIIGGVIGGLLLMALITVALYKAGFFKSEYKQMLEEAQGAAGAETAQ
ncbi:integrin alpha-M-like isoform X2 [Triplophysa dalaica]|uniref:integrin alpha-M-like isoform X2 n=1 Tax=Triplophysa dalaica TaxID=1582913 RepID=UPI0024DF6E73|nr:integrin alpha-M-like isoform X2 [Triplophysa dalaica]